MRGRNEVGLVLGPVSIKCLIPFLFWKQDGVCSCMDLLKWEITSEKTCTKFQSLLCGYFSGYMFYLG